MTPSKKLIFAISIIAVCAAAYAGFRNFTKPQNFSSEYSLQEISNIFLGQKNILPRSIPEPHEVKAIHLSYNTYHSSRFPGILEEIKNSQINAIIFEIKDPIGLVAINSERHAETLKELIPELNRKGIHVVARMVLFQDIKLVESRPELAIKDSRTGGLWRDNKGVAWSDPTLRDVWDHNIDIASRALDLGFNEVNFDYVRFPTDGPIKYTQYSNLHEYGAKDDTIAAFLEFAREELGTNTLISIDVFGMTFIHDQLVIGQNIVKMAPHVDIIMPMPYPSHYPTGFRGLANPAQHPYEILHYTTERGIAKLGEDNPVVIRSWLQDFNLGAVYGPHEVREQIRAVNDFDQDTWALWNAANRYNWEAVR